MKQEEKCDKIIVFVTTPSKSEAEKIATELVGNKLAACVSISGPMTSLYSWEGKLNKDEEVLLFIKSRAHLLSAIVETVKKLHPYICPEIIATPISGGLTSYLSWIDNNVQPMD